ncbi:MAG: heavy metal translocating P-type ATPase [Saccharofermentans sp.]|nr:heavy metal translocating P-type ATPase [Saccharofermentans sp.]
MTKYDVTGMSCAACQAHVEKAVNGVSGVTSCAVSLLTNSMTVEGSADPDAVIAAVSKAGYGASVAGSAKKTESVLDTTTKPLIRRLISSVLLLLVLMYFSMGVHMWGFPVPAFLSGNAVGLGIVQMLLAGLIMVINQKFFVSGIKTLLHLSPNMDTLVALGSGVSFGYSFCVLLAMTVDKGDGHLYFESAAMIVTLITIGKMLESISKGKTTNALKDLMDLTPKTAVVVRNGMDVTVPCEEVIKGDIFKVKPGEQIPVDGIVIEGVSAVDESALTGESIPVDKEAGSVVSAGTINSSGYILCKATKVGEDTTLAQIIKMVSESAATKAPIAKIADKVAGVFVPCVLVIAAIVTAIWLISGKDIGFSLTRGIAVLVVSCPCALGLATPVAIMVGSGLGARSGILFKTSAVLEQTGKIKIVAMDKTGTITRGKPEVTDVIPDEGADTGELLYVAYSLEAKSEHPLGKAVTEYADLNKVSLAETEGFEAVPGKGLKGSIEGISVYGGNIGYISSVCSVPAIALEEASRLQDKGRTCMFFAKDGEYLGLIGVADSIKPDAAKAIKQLGDMGINVVMLTGDSEKTANAIAIEAGIRDVVSGVLPGGKSSVIKKLKEFGSVAMVGDGINDAVALTEADVGIAIGAGSDVAINSADIVLVRSALEDVPAAIRISRKTTLNIKENLFWAFIYNVALIPLAAGAYASLGLTLNPMLGALAMSLSSFTVCMNALRINLYDPYKPGRTKKADVLDITNIIQGEKTMTKTMKIEGMMCGHCEASVKKALEAIDGVASAEVSHEKDEAVVTLDSEVSDEILTKAVEDKDYKVISIS